MWLHQCEKANLDSLGDWSAQRHEEYPRGTSAKMTLGSREFSMARMWLETEAGKKGASLSDACLTASLGDTMPLIGTSVSLIYCRLNEKRFDILHLLLCHIGRKIVKGLPGFL